MSQGDSKPKHFGARKKMRGKEVRRITPAETPRERMVRVVMEVKKKQMR